MNTSTACITLLVALILASGCRDNDPDVTVADTSDTSALANSAKLRGLPAPVQASFRSQYPNTTITSVEPLRTDGPPMYRIGYIRAGETGEVTYRLDGTTYVPPAPTPAPRVTTP